MGDGDFLLLPPIPIQEPQEDFIDEGVAPSHLIKQ